MKSYIAATTVAFLLTATTALAADVEQNVLESKAVQTATVDSTNAIVQEAGTTKKRIYPLHLDKNDYTLDTMKYQGESIVFRSYEHNVYVQYPVDETYQSMNIYVPEGYYEGKTIHGFTAETAPIFLPNTIGGYMPGKAGEPLEKDDRTGGPNAILAALAHGYVVAAPGARGRTNVDANDTYTGKAPACIVDMKAAVRYLRYNKDVIPGDMDKIVTNGTSAGGAVSALMGATGNNKDYEPYLRTLGAAEERDDVFASSVYCPITDLEHADMAYEWMFSHVHKYYGHQNIAPMTGTLTVGSETVALGPGPVIADSHSTDENNKNMIVMNRPDNAPIEETEAVNLTEQQVYLSQKLKKAFSGYVNDLKLVDENQRKLKLNKKGEGTFKEYIASLYKASAQSAINKGEDLSNVDWVHVQDGHVTGVDLAAYANDVTRLKGVPAFDDLGLESGENEEFGTAKIKSRHFTDIGEKFSTVHVKGQADSHVIAMMNPLHYIGKKGTTTARYWRIRHGSTDRDTTLAVPAILALKLKQDGCHVDFAVPWNQGHGGDYDIDELFAWIDGIAGPQPDDGKTKTLK